MHAYGGCTVELIYNQDEAQWLARVLLLLKEKYPGIALKTREDDVLGIDLRSIMLSEGGAIADSNHTLFGEIMRLIEEARTSK